MRNAILSLAFLGLVAQPVPAHANPEAPVGCTITAAWEDGSRLATCADGTHLAYDPDGQPYANAAGVPVRAPGWYEVAR